MGMDGNAHRDIKGRVAEAVSPDGVAFYADRFTGAELLEQEAKLGEVKAAHEADAGDLPKLLAVGRQLAAMWRYREAIALYTGGLEIHPDSWELYRFRGHRHITTRRFAEAERDLLRARELGGDTFDILYHLGLARWLLGDFVGAVEPYQACYRAAGESENKVAIMKWLYLTLLRAGQPGAASELLADTYAPEVGENVPYDLLIRLYKGELAEATLLGMRSEHQDPGDAFNLAVGYGVGAWRLIHGDETRALRIFREVLSERFWSAFGFIAAEAEVARLRK